MCLYTKQMLNQKYTPTKKNGGCVPALPVAGKDEYGMLQFDQRVEYVPIPCGNCIECRKQKARGWQIRMNEEIKQHEYNYFITLTFNNESLQNVMRKLNLSECNAVAGYAVRHSLELWRKHNKCQLKHWYITELGHENTERIHLHGLIFSDKPLEFEEVKGLNHMYTWKYWKYGHVYVGDYVSERTINYIVKYVTKIDTDHKGFVGEIMCSPGIGRSYVDANKDRFNYRPREARNYYTLPNGAKAKLPAYYKNHFYNEDERELMWREQMDTGDTYIMGNRYSDRIVTDKNIGDVLTKQREVNGRLGYGSRDKAWRKKEWNITQRMLRRAEIEEEITKKMQEKFGDIK